MNSNGNIENLFLRFWYILTLCFTRVNMESVVAARKIIQVHIRFLSDTQREQ